MSNNHPLLPTAIGRPCPAQRFSGVDGNSHRARVGPVQSGGAVGYDATERAAEPQIMNTEKITFTNTALPDVIELRGVGQSYDAGKTWVIKDLDLLIENIPNQGQFVMILGKSGCGKSTLLRYIAGLQKPTEGQVLIHAQPRPEELAISMVFQQYPSMPCYTVLENVALPLRYRHVPKAARTQLAMEMIQLVGLDGQQSKYAKAPDLSGGQLQRVALARCLVTNPEIILMDEPFGALDTRTRLDMQLLVFKVWEKLNSTIVFVTHDIGEAVFLADDIYLMKSNPGQIIRQFHVDLEFNRTRETKIQPRFVQLVNEVEAALMEISG